MNILSTLAEPRLQFYLTIWLQEFITKREAVLIISDLMTTWDQNLKRPLWIRFLMTTWDQNLKRPLWMDFEALKLFKRSIVDTLDKYAPLKKKYLRANHFNFVAKELSKAILNRSKWRNQFFKNRSVESRMNYNKQRNICVALLRKTN